MGNPCCHHLWWKTIRATFNCPYAVYNVWHQQPLRGNERIKDSNGKYLHPNQKPLDLMRMLVESSSLAGDVVWDVYGGVLTGALACQQIDRVCYTAEPNEVYFNAGVSRLQ